MFNSRRHLVIRYSLLTVGLIVLLPIWYVLAWLAVSRAAGDGLIGNGTVTLVRPVFLPLIRYCDQPRPFAESLSALWWQTNPLLVFRNQAPSPFDLKVVYKPTNAHVLCPSDLTDVQFETAMPTGQ